MRNLILASIFLVTSNLFGGDKFFSQDTGAIDLTLDGPSSATIGDLVELDSGDVPYIGRPTWVVTTPIKKGGWKVFTSNREDDVVKKDNHFVFSTPYPGKYCVVFSFSVIDSEGMKPEGVDKTKVKTQSIIHWINITSLDETPTPDPTPDIVPTPKIDEKYGFITLTKKWLGEMPEVQRSKKSDVSDVFASVSAQIAAGTIKDMDEIISKTASSIRTKIPNQLDRDVWNKFFMTKMSSQLEDLDNEGKLNTLDNYKDCWAEISRGLK